MFLIYIYIDNMNVIKKEIKNNNWKKFDNIYLIIVHWIKKKHPPCCKNNQAYGGRALYAISFYELVALTKKVKEDVD